MPRAKQTSTSGPWPQYGWEYDVQLLDYVAEEGWSDLLDELGAEGWRVVTMIHDEDPASKDRWVRVVLERPRTRPREGSGEPRVAASNKPPISTRRDGTTDDEDEDESEDADG